MANYSGRYRLPKRGECPFVMEYDSELDVSPELETDVASYFQSIIGKLRWMTVLGMIDIIINVSLLLSHIVLPRKRAPGGSSTCNYLCQAEALLQINS